MPIISVFLGITVRMYYADHPPPHVHASYQGFEALVEIKSGKVVAGSLPARPLALLREWLDRRQSDILDNWNRAEALEAIERVPGLDAD